MMPWTELGTMKNTGTAWTPVLRTPTNNQSGWSHTAAGCIYRRVGDLIVGRGAITGTSVNYGTGAWHVSLPVTPNLSTSSEQLIGDVYFYNNGRATYGNLFWTATGPSYGALLMSVHATDNYFYSWEAAGFAENGGSGKSIMFTFAYEGV